MMRMRWRAGFVVVMLLVAGCASKAAMPTGIGHKVGAAFNPIANESGAQFRADVNARFSGATPIAPAFATTLAPVTAATSTINPAIEHYDCDASSNNVFIKLGAASGSGRFFTLKKLDSSSNICEFSPTVRSTFAGCPGNHDSIDQGLGLGSSGLTVQNQWYTIHDAFNCNWDIVSSSTSAGGGIPQGGPLTSPLLTGGESIEGSTTTGADVISNMSVNGQFNPMAFGATGTGIFGTDDSAALQATVDMDCLSNNVSDAHVSATTVLLPPASYRMTYPLWVNCAGLNLVGAGMYSSVLSPTYDFGPTVAFAPGAYKGIPTTTSLVAGPGKALDFTVSQNSYRLNLREWDGLNGPLASVASCTATNTPSKGCTGTGTGNFGMNLLGQPALTAEAFVKDEKTCVAHPTVVCAVNGDCPGGDTCGAVTDGLVVSSSGRQSNSIGQTYGFYLRINGGDWLALFNTTGGNCLASGGAVTPGTTYFVAGTYDGTTCRLYVCTPGQSSCAVAASGTATGTIVQGPTEDVSIGPDLNEWAPASLNSMKGYIDSVRISNIARYTGTITTAPSIKFSADSNTLILTNGEQAPGAVTANTPNGAPFFKAYDVAPSGGYGFGWLFAYNTDRTTATNYYIAENGMRELGIRGVADNSGFIYDDGKDSNFEDLYLQQMEVGIETFELAYEARNFSNITILGAPGRYGINDIGGGLNNWKGTKINTFWACEVATTDTWINPLCLQGNSGTSRYGLVLNNLEGANPNEVTVIDAVDDSENSGNLQTPFYVIGNGGAAVLNVIGGEPEAEDGAPIAYLDSGGVVNFQGTAITSNGGTPTQIVQAAGSTTGVATISGGAKFIGWGSAALSSTAGAARITPCRGLVTLSSGAGTFTDVCVTTRSVCSGIDTTTFANPVCSSIPCAVSSGSASITGTGTDVIQVSCN